MRDNSGSEECLPAASGEPVSAPHSVYLGAVWFPPAWEVARSGLNPSSALASCTNFTCHLASPLPSVRAMSPVLRLSEVLRDQECGSWWWAASPVWKSWIGSQHDISEMSKGPCTCPGSLCGCEDCDCFPTRRVGPSRVCPLTWCLRLCMCDGGGAICVCVRERRGCDSAKGMGLLGPRGSWSAGC